MFANQGSRGFGARSRANEETIEPFTFRLDRFHSFDITNQNELASAVFYVEYVKKMQGMTAMRCA